MAKISVNGVEFGYDEAGSGPAASDAASAGKSTSAVVLLHAGIGDRRMWDAQFAALARDHRVIRYDRRGFGESSYGEGGYAHYEDLLSLLDAWGIEQAALVGSSMGGACAMDAALAAPSRITRLVLIGSGLSGHEWPPAMRADIAALTSAAVPADRLARYQAGGATPDPADVAAIADANLRYAVAGPGRSLDALPPDVLALAREMCEHVYFRTWSGPQWTERIPDTRLRLGEITAPALVVIGLADAPGLVELSHHLAESLPGAERVDLPDTGHLPQLERPDAVTALLRKFL